MGGGARRIHTEFEREVVDRLERIEKRLEHAGLHMPCLLDKPPEGWTERTGRGIGAEAVTIKGRIMQLPSPPRLIPDENESYGYIDDRGEVGMQDFDGGKPA